MRWFALLVCAWAVSAHVHAQVRDSVQVAGSACHPVSDTDRVVVAGGSITEILYALELEDRLVGVDRTSNFPAAALGLPSVGYVRNLSAEGVLSLQPTLILGEDDMGPDSVLSQVRGAGVQVVQFLEAHTATGILEKVDCVATTMDADKKLFARLRKKMAAQIEQLSVVDSANGPRVAVLLSLTDGVPTAGGANTSAHGLLAMAGAENVFVEVDGWKPISLEVMAKLDPEFIVMPTRGVVAAGGRDAVLGHPALRLTKAGREGNLIELDGMAMLGFGPRTLGVAFDLAQRFGTVDSLGAFDD